MKTVRRKLEDQSGYSLVEVLAAIVILSIAIIPMIAMFDSGLRAAALGDNYDTARALAKKQSEQSQSLSYGTVKTSFPDSPSSFNGSGLSVTADRTDSDPSFDGFEYTVEKQFVEISGSGGTTFDDSDRDVGLMEITVIVNWDDDKTYQTTSLKAR